VIELAITPIISDIHNFLIIEYKLVVKPCFYVLKPHH